MMIWDIHHHWVNEEGYIDQLLREMDALGIERTGLIAMGSLVTGLFLRGKLVGPWGNDDVARVVQQHGDRFWGYGFIRPGHDKPTEIDRLAEMGLTGLKLHLPVKPYGDPEYFELYARAAHHQLPCLFHTGIFYPPEPMPGAGIRSENYRPIHLEPIAHEFPNLVLIAAHLGVCWNEEAVTLCRVCPNIYVDWSGRADGWRSTRSVDWFRSVFNWPDAHKKILFGSDVHASELHQSLRDQERIIQGMGWNEEQRADVFCGNAQHIFGQATHMPSVQGT